MLGTKAGPIDELGMEVSHLRAMFCMHCLDNIFTCATHCLSYYSLNSLCFIRFEFVCKSILSSIWTRFMRYWNRLVISSYSWLYHQLCVLHIVQPVENASGVVFHRHHSEFSSNLAEQSHGHQ